MISNFRKKEDSNDLFDKVYGEVQSKEEYKFLIENGINPLEQINEIITNEENEKIIDGSWNLASKALSDKLIDNIELPAFNLDMSKCDDSYYEWIGDDYKEFTENKYYVSRPRRANTLFFINLIVRYIESGGKGPMSLVIVEYLYEIDNLNYLFKLFPSLKFNVIIFSLCPYVHSYEPGKIFVHYSTFDYNVIKSELYTNCILYANLIPLWCIKVKGMIISRRVYEKLSTHTMIKNIQLVSQLKPKQSTTMLFYQIFIDLDDVTYDKIELSPYMTLIGNAVLIYNIKLKAGEERLYEDSFNKNNGIKLLRYAQWYLMNVSWKKTQKTFLDDIIPEYRQYIPVNYDGQWEINMWIRYLKLVNLPSTEKNIIACVYFLSKQFFRFTFLKVNACENEKIAKSYYVIFRTLTRIKQPVYLNNFTVYIDPQTYFDDVYELSETTKNIINKYKLYNEFDVSTLIDRKLSIDVKGFNYDDVKNIIPKVYCHIGQRKLFMGELEFMSKYISKYHMVGITHIHYVGAAPGHHIKNLIMEMPYSYVWFLYDPRDFDAELIALAKKIPKNLFLFNKFFTLEDAIKIKEGKKPYFNYLFISDLRQDFDHTNVDNMNKTFEEDNILQFDSYRIIDPEMAMFKFKMPYSWNKPLDIPFGDFYPQVWVGHDSTETRLIVGKSAPFRTISIKEYEISCQYHNFKDRFNIYKNVLSDLPSDLKFGLNDYYDSSAEMTIIYHWLKNIIRTVKVSDVYRFIENVIVSNESMKVRNTCYFNDEEAKDFFNKLSQKVKNKSFAQKTITYDLNKIKLEDNTNDI